MHERIPVEVVIVSEYQMHISVQLFMKNEYYNMNIAKRMIEFRRIGTKPLLIAGWDAFEDPFNPQEAEILFLGMLHTLSEEVLDILRAGLHLLRNRSKMQNGQIKNNVAKMLSDFLDVEKYSVKELER